MFLKVPRKFLKFRWLQNCQGSGVSSILIGRSITSNHLPRRQPSQEEPMTHPLATKGGAPSAFLWLAITEQ